MFVSMFQSEVSLVLLSFQVKRLEKLVVDMQSGFDKELSRLNAELAEERSARRALEDEVKAAARRL